MNRIGIACDHAGFEMKEFLIGYLKAQGYDIHDFGCYSEESCDYPDAAHPLAIAVEKGEVETGVALCGSANGISMTLNKHQGVRAAICWRRELAELARAHNDANVISIPARFITSHEAAELVRIFLETPFEGGRHTWRVAKIPVNNG